MVERRRTLLRWALWVPCLVLLGAAAVVSGADPEPAGWPQWGGPHRDFTTDVIGLADSWPEGGPKELWRRSLGDDGYSAVLSDGSRLYTMVRRGEKDVVVCLDASSGETVWETAYAAPMKDDMVLDFGPGPHSTPVLAGDRLFAVGATVKLHAFDKATGEVLWAHDLMEEMGASHLGRGYGASPLAWKDLVILTVGGEGHGVVAFRQATGEVAWKSQSFRPGYSSAIVGTPDGAEQVIVAMGPDRAGLDPATGELLWHVPLERDEGSIMSTQIWGDDGLLFGSSAYAGGSTVIRVSREEEGFKAETVWQSRKMRVQHGSAVRIGDYVYGSSGDFGPALLSAVHVPTGELAFRQRGFAKANLVEADGKLIILDEDGNLALGMPSAEGIEVVSKAKVLDRLSWTAPTVVGSRLYARDRKQIVAFDLGKS